MKNEIVSGIFYVGYVDWTLRDFHSFDAKRGVTYNSYLILDEKKALIDTVKLPFFEELIKNINNYSTLGDIDYIVVNHAEPDHSSALGEIVKRCKKAKIVCNQKCKETLSYYFDIKDWNFHIVKDKDILHLGKRSLEFIETPMLHWPESMFTYLKEEELLFSQDGFGQHFSFSRLFDDESDICEIMEEAKKYYANILMPFGRIVLNVLEKIANYKIKIIAPAHGIIWRKNIFEIIKLYKEWANFTPKAKVVIFYDTMWQSTKLVAEEILRGVESLNVEAKLYNVRTTSFTDMAAEILDAATLAFGSSTLNMSMMPMMGALLTYFKGLSPKNKIALSFGCYGWGKGAAEVIHEKLKEMNFELCEPLKIRWKASDNDLKLCYDLGCLLAKKTLTKVGLT